MDNFTGFVDSYKKLSFQNLSCNPADLISMQFFLIDLSTAVLLTTVHKFYIVLWKREFIAVLDFKVTVISADIKKSVPA